MYRIHQYPFVLPLLFAFFIILPLFYTCAPSNPTPSESLQESATQESIQEQSAQESISPKESPSQEATIELNVSNESSPNDGAPNDDLPETNPSQEQDPSEKTLPPETTPEKPPQPSNVHLYPPTDPSTFQNLQPTTPEPPLQPKLLALTYAGGKGNQSIRSIRFAADGSITAEGKGFAILYDASGTKGRITGDPNTIDNDPTTERPALPGDPGRAYNHTPTGLTFRVGYRQAGGNLQMPIFRAFQGTTRLWALWGHAVQDAIDRKVTADSRCYQAWGMPQGRIGVQCWTDGGNSVLAKDPRDLSLPGFNPAWAQGAYQNSAGGMASLYALIDPNNGGSVISGTFVASHVPVLAVDAWGRVYLARTGSSRSGNPGPTNPFNQATSANSGLLALSTSLKTALFHARIGGDCSGGQQYFTVAALRNNLLVLGGTTCASNLQTTQAPQTQHGGDQDGFLAILQLWPLP